MVLHGPPAQEQTQTLGVSMKRKERVSDNEIALRQELKNTRAVRDDLLAACKWALSECGAEADETGLTEFIRAAIAKAEGASLPGTESK